MTTGKYLALNANGDTAETAALTTSAGAASAGGLVALNAAGQVDTTMLPGSDAVTLLASESIAAGALINIWSNSGVASMRNADNSAIGKQAHGFAPSAVANGASGTAQIGNGPNSSLTGLTIGAQYFLGSVGAVTTTPPGAGSVLQRVGVAQSATELQVILGPPVQR